MNAMTVREVMTRDVVTIDSATSCERARRLMDQHCVRHLPVVDEGRLVGMVSDRDVRSAVLHAADLAAGRIMTRAPVTVTPATRVDHAALLLLEGCVGALLVVEGRALVGIVTYVDVLVALVHMLGTEPEERLGLAAS